ncbi:MAG: serine hydrolase domain-containing protein [Planctomycetota bacterium]|jgi:CubicO group peptidase (beta-lactamase class C family)
MRRPNCFVVLLAVLAALWDAGEAFGKEPRETETFAKGKVGKQIVGWVEKAESAGFSGAVLAARDGKVVAAVAVGSADLDGKVPNTPATLFEIASATKPFTAIAVMRLVERKKVKLDAPMAKYLPGIPEDCRAITVRHLLQHTSGIPGTNSRGGGTDLARVLPSFLKGGPRHEPGTHWEYWNQGYALASEVIARASGKSFVDYCRRAIFRPAKMTVTCFTGDRTPRGATVAVGRSARGPARSALEHPYGEYGFQYRGMGGIVTNVWDLWRWDRALHGKLLKPESKKLLFEPGLNDYALGWRVKREGGRILQSHGGSVRGFVCDVRRYPEQEACVFVLCNRDDAPLRTVALAVEQMLFEEPVTARLSRGLAPELVERLVGEYVDARGNRLEVKEHGKELRAHIRWTAGMVSRMTIHQEADGKLVIVQGRKTYKLRVGEARDGKASSLTIDDHVYKRKQVTCLLPAAAIDLGAAERRTPIVCRECSRSERQWIRDNRRRAYDAPWPRARSSLWEVTVRCSGRTDQLDLGCHFPGSRMYP